MGSNDYDVLVLGGGSAGEYIASELARRDRRVVVVEERLVGGECPYVACIPSKTMLLTGERGHDWADAVRRRDDSAKHGDDRSTVRSLERLGVTVVRGHGRVTGPKSVVVGETAYDYEHLVVSTGGSPAMPPVDGLFEAKPWTSENALTSDELPRHLLVLGGGPIGCELAQVYATFGAHVTMVETMDRLLPREPDFVGHAVAESLVARGVDVRTRVKANRVTRDDGVVRLHLDDESAIDGDRLLVAAGKKPRTAGLGLEALGISVDDGDQLVVDDSCRVAGTTNVWAAGDVTGIAPYTHTANYQARTVVAGISGRPARADYRAIPRCVFTDPAVFAVGLTPDQAAEQGIDVVTAAFDVGDTARAYVERKAGMHAVAGRLELYADRDRGVLVGAAAVGPYADTWTGELVLAVHAEVPVRVLAQVVHAFPTVGEAIEPPARELAEALETP